MRQRSSRSSRNRLRAALRAKAGCRLLSTSWSTAEPAPREPQQEQPYRDDGDDRDAIARFRLLRGNPLASLDAALVDHRLRHELEGEINAEGHEYEIVEVAQHRNEIGYQVDRRQ